MENSNFFNSAAEILKSGAEIVTAKLIAGKGAFDNIKNKTRENW